MYIAALVQSVGLELVGPYHVLAGQLEGVTWERCTLQSRYFYDPPEMVTVVRRVSSSSQYHLGYFRLVKITRERVASWGCVYVVRA